MAKLTLSLLTVTLLVLTGCKPVQITKSYTEEYTDPATGKVITYTETISQFPGDKAPIHLTHPELYE